MTDRLTPPDGPNMRALAERMARVRAKQNTAAMAQRIRDTAEQLREAADALAVGDRLTFTLRLQDAESMMVTLVANLAEARLLLARAQRADVERS